ncbi:Oidioi.mRNA.OKI2018_I69.chr2.g4286.t1.cds [Oikopleura dioica]|uniref:Oidioi.mRNA.OKI2018_I69.chr2.g4286.t1.cds n=1 Tax=Oikopleura dioica TaxID=34765 RepID=A0ABN7SWV3_OIKDI|nr:Oidioi.mRNA.OKI2018_I69.chr2.g4286.t1.cds [Oikopleura dioica]
MFNSALDFRRRTIGLVGMGWFALTAVTFLHFKNASAEESREIIQIYMASCFIFVVYLLQQLCRGRRVGFVKNIYVNKNGDLALLTQSLTTRFPQGAVHEGKFRDVKIFVNISSQDGDFTVIPGMG